MKTLVKLGKQITARKKQLKYTQADLAAISDLSIVSIRAIENGKAGVSIANWIKAADVLGFDLRLVTQKNE